MQVFAILPAAGLGTRMAGPQPKQFLSLGGLPILIHSLRAFASVDRVKAIYVAVRKTEIDHVLRFNDHVVHSLQDYVIFNAFGEGSDLRSHLRKVARGKIMSEWDDLAGASLPRKAAYLAVGMNNRQILR